MSQRIPSGQIAKTRSLRAQGLSYREIGEKLGIDTSTAARHAKDVPLPARECEYCGEPIEASDPRRRYCSARCRRDRCQDDARGRCVDCGEELGAGSRWRGVLRCKKCHQTHVRGQHRLRDRQIEGWWNEGLSGREICERLGWTQTHLSRELYRLRERGYDLPYRQPPPNPRFPKCLPR